MTYQVLQTPSQTLATPESEYVSQGTDAAEARHWATVYGQGVVDEDDEVQRQQELIDMGLS